MTRNAMTRPLALLLSLGLAAAGQAVSQEDDAAEIDNLRNARNLLVDASDLSAALGPARQVVEAAEDADDPLLGQDLMILARIQSGLRDFADAEELYLRAIEQVTEDQGPTALPLAAAYQGLGRNYLNERRFDEALLAFEDAREISRRNEGLFNVDQASILDDMTLAYLGTGNTLDAYDLQHERLATAIRRFGEEDPRLIGFHTHLGDYLNNSRLRTGAREQYARALELSRATFGEASAEAISILSRLAEIDLTLDQDNGVPAEIESALATAGDALDPVVRARANMALGDFAIVYQGAAAATPHYRAAFDALAGTGTIDPNAVFGGPQPLNLVPPLSRVDRNRKSDLWSWGDVTLRFDVSADGRASNVEVVTMTPELEDLADDYVRRIREAFFRPRIVDGEPVGTADTRYTHSFRFYVEED